MRDYSKEFNICQIKNCYNEVAAITKENRKFSKIYCEKHSIEGVKVICKTCQNSRFIRASIYNCNAEYECLRCIKVRTAYEGAENRIKKMKENGSYEKWRKSCESKEARSLGYKNMIENGNIKNLISASNDLEVLKRKQESRINSGGFERFMKASKEKNNFLWNNDKKYRLQKLKQIGAVPTFLNENPNCKFHENEIKKYFDSLINDYVCWS